MKKLRLKMIGIVFASVVAAFMVMTIILVMCFGAYRNRQADQITAMISENNGTVPQLKDYKQQQKNSQAFERYFNNYNEDSSYRTRFFRIFLDEDKKVTNVNMDHIAAVDVKKAVRMTKMAMLRRGKVGLVGSYRYRKEYKDGQVRSIIFLDCKENQSFYHLAVTITITVSTLLTCLITVIFAIASKRAVVRLKSIPTGKNSLSPMPAMNSKHRLPLFQQMRRYCSTKVMEMNGRKILLIRPNIWESLSINCSFSQS